MRVMMMVKTSGQSEDGMLRDAEVRLAAMGKYNEELQKAGVLLDLAGLQPTARASKIRYEGKKRTVVDGPFAEAKELIAGFWIFDVQSKQEAIDWVRRCPNPLDGDAEIEIRQIFEDADFNDVSTPELQAAEARLREQLNKK